MCCFSRSPHGTFPEYHTSADNLDFVRPANLADSLSMSWSILDVHEGNRTYINRCPFGEPQLGRGGLYRKTGGQSRTPVDELAMLWVLNLSDGHHSLLDVAERAGLKFSLVRDAADCLAQHDLLEGRDSEHEPFVSSQEFGEQRSSS